MKTNGNSPFRVSLAPAWFLVAVAAFLFLRPLACRGTQPLVLVPDDGPLYFDSGPDSGPDAGDAGDGGYHADGGCEIGGTVFPIGIWQNLALGSCTVCDPEVNPNGWTVFDAGEPCRGFGRLTYFGGGLTVPFAGVCSYDRPFGTCGGEIAGNSCASDQGCAGGFCNSQHWCEVNQNLAWFTACGGGSVVGNACATGPCCFDGGYANVIPDGGGWCCGLVDGGAPTCLPEGNVCVTVANCCPGLVCTTAGGVIPGDAGGYGTCEDGGP